MTGALSLHGVTRDKTLNLSVRLKDDAIAAEGDFTLNQTDFGIQPVKVAGDAAAGGRRAGKLMRGNERSVFPGPTTGARQ